MARRHMSERRYTGISSGMLHSRRALPQRTSKSCLAAFCDPRLVGQALVAAVLVAAQAGLRHRTCRRRPAPAATYDRGPWRRAGDWRPHHPTAPRRGGTQCRDLRNRARRSQDSRPCRADATAHGPDSAGHRPVSRAATTLFPTVSSRGHPGLSIQHQDSGVPAPSPANFCRYGADAAMPSIPLQPCLPTPLPKNKKRKATGQSASLARSVAIRLAVGRAPISMPCSLNCRNRWRHQLSSALFSVGIARNLDAQLFRCRRTCDPVDASQKA